MDYKKTGWNSLYWNNHDQPRIVSRFGNDGEYRVRSAKMLATCLHMMKGTPYIYQGEEIGMTNVRFDDLADYRDIETLNMYRDRIEQGFSHDEIMKSIYTKGRDNARTPFQWDSSENAGFTTGIPWLKVNPRYVEINSEAALHDVDSIFYYYQTLIRLRKEMPVIVHGSFELLLPKHEAIFAYRRQLDREKLIVICNFSAIAQRIEDEALLKDIAHGQVLLTNSEVADTNVLEAYQAIVYKI